MSYIVIPEFIIQTTIERLLKFVQDDYEAQSDKTQSYLYKAITDAGFQRYNFYDQAIEVFCGAIDSPRKLEVDLMFNYKRNGAPTIHITLPAETPAAQGNGLGVDEGWEDPIYVDNDEAAQPPVQGTATAVFTRRYSAVYDIVVTSDNTLEVILIYHMLRSLLTANIYDFNARGLEQISFSGQDVRPYADLANTLYMRAVRMSLQYDTSSIAFEAEYMPNDIVTVPHPTD